MKRERVPRAQWGKALPCGDGALERLMVRRVMRLLARVRKEKHIPVLEMAEATRLTRQALNLMEAGGHGQRLENFLRCCHACNVAPHAVFAGIEKALGWTNLERNPHWQGNLPI